jgi:hypothetical protein
MELVAPVGFCVWLRNAAQAETSMLVHCCDEFTKPLTTTFQVACSVLHDTDNAELVNNIPYLLFDHLE